MRFLVSEKSYETPIAAGLLRESRDERATGVTEQWRLTHTEHGDRILRVDHDARAAGGGSFLYHLLQTEDGQPQRLTYRYFGNNQFELSGNVLFSDGAIVNSRKIGDEYRDEEVSSAPFFFPTTIGRSVLAQTRPDGLLVSLVTDCAHDDAQFMSLRTVDAKWQPQRTRDIKRVKFGRTTHMAITLTLTHDNESHMLWIERKHRWPVRMRNQDGLEALETRYIWYDA